MNRFLTLSFVAALVFAPVCAQAQSVNARVAALEQAVATLTTRVKAKFAEDKTVSAMAISVETFKGVVMLSGVAKSSEERMKAESLARHTSGVVDVKNEIIVRAG